MGIERSRISTSQIGNEMTQMGIELQSITQKFTTSNCKNNDLPISATYENVSDIGNNKPDPKKQYDAALIDDVDDILF